MKRNLQIMPALDEGALGALRASINHHGVLVPVMRDQHGRILDGHHRVAIAEELGIDYPIEVLEVADDGHAYEVAGTLNLARRHLAPGQRRTLAADLKADKHSLRNIAKALGVSQEQVRRDLSAVTSVTPDEVLGADGKTYSHRSAYEVDADDVEPATLPARDVVAGDSVIDDAGDELEARSARRVSKPDLGGGISHPARFSWPLIPIFAEALPPDRYPRVLDPFAGTGRIHELPNETVGVEIEPEWAAMHPDTEVGSALAMRFADESFDAVCTSPCYGNRLADSHDAADGSLRRSYTHDLGRKLHADNAGSLQWGERYRKFHSVAWEEAWRVLRPGGRLVLNIKDHDRHHARQHVTAWHVTELMRLGFDLVWFDQLDTGGLRQGENSDDRYLEQVIVFDRPGDRT